MAKSHRFVGVPRVEVRPAGVKGRGVFATKALKRGEVVERAPALLIPRDEVDDMLTSFLAHYIFRTDTGYRYVLALGFGSLYNHADKPNAEFSVEKDRVTIRAIRPIAAEAEITVSYGWTKKEWALIGGYVP